ncbi:MAG: hypothetical protein E6X17_13320 [Sporomusaceae bacterium]|nr:hypothetical protein [Sporomusaceae bacterium]
MIIKHDDTMRKQAKACTAAWEQMTDTYAQLPMQRGDFDNYLKSYGINWRFKQNLSLADFVRINSAQLWLEDWPEEDVRAFRDSLTPDRTVFVEGIEFLSGEGATHYADLWSVDGALLLAERTRKHDLLIEVRPLEDVSPRYPQCILMAWMKQFRFI